MHKLQTIDSLEPFQTDQSLLGEFSWTKREFEKSKWGSGLNLDGFYDDFKLVKDIGKGSSGKVYLYERAVDGS